MDTEAIEPAADEAGPPEHVNVFDNEPEFLAHYAAAREMARSPLNHIRVCDGEDLLGIPFADDRGRVMETMGRVMWRSLPRAGWALLPGEPPGWAPVRFLAPYLQSTLTNPEAAMRITPEVRVERLGAQSLLIRTLTVELKIMAAIQVDADMAMRVKASARPYVKAWFPLHPEVECEWTATPPSHEDVEIEIEGIAHAHRLVFTSILLRFRGDHSRPELGSGSLVG